MQLENTRNLSKVLQIYFPRWYLHLIGGVQEEIFGEEALVGAVKSLDKLTMREFDGDKP